MHTLAENTFFSKGLAQRNARCKNKDALTHKLLDELVIQRPRAFRALLMPSMFGPEVGMLRERGVPIQNMFAIERDLKVHASYAAGMFKGIQTTEHPCSAVVAADHVPWPVNLAYLDFFGQPDGDHLEALRKLMRLGIVRRGTTLITTFGANRGDTFSCDVNRRIRSTKKEPGECYVRAAAELAGLTVQDVSSQSYLTDTHIKFVVTRSRL